MKSYLSFHVFRTASHPYTPYNLNKGDDYSQTKPALQIGILDFEIFENDIEFYATYHLANDISHKIFSDKFHLSVLQLNQSEYATEEDIACKRILWAKFFKATTWEEVSMLANHDPIFAEAAKTIYRVTEDERVRYHCDAIERGERTHRTLVNQLNEQEQQLADMNQQLSDRDQLLATKDKQLQKFQQKLKDKIQRKISKGKTLEQIADELEEDVENIRPLYEELLQNAK